VGSGLVLVVDDESYIRETTARLLRRRNVGVLVAPNGAEALRQLEENPDIRVVLLDWHMPGMCGGYLLETMREQFPDVWIIVASGDFPLFEMDENTGFLPKPFRYDLLHGGVVAALRDEPMPLYLKQ